MAVMWSSGESQPTYMQLQEHKAEKHMEILLSCLIYKEQMNFSNWLFKKEEEGIEAFQLYFADVPFGVSIFSSSQKGRPVM